MSKCKILTQSRESNIDRTSKKDLTTLIFVNLKFINTFASRDVGLPRPKKNNE